jgi:hypothetical protein
MAINISGARTDDESELIELAMHTTLFLGWVASTRSSGSSRRTQTRRRKGQAHETQVVGSGSRVGRTRAGTEWVHDRDASIEDGDALSQRRRPEQVLFMEPRLT